MIGQIIAGVEAHGANTLRVIFAVGEGSAGGADDEAIRCIRRRAHGAWAIGTWIFYIEIPMRRNPVGAEAFNASRLQVEGIDRSGGNALRIRRQVHGAAGSRPRRGPAGRRAAIVRQAIHLARQIKWSSAAVVVQLAEVVIETAVLLRQEDDVIDRLATAVAVGRGSSPVTPLQPVRAGENRVERAKGASSEAWRANAY